MKRIGLILSMLLAAGLTGRSADAQTKQELFHFSHEFHVNMGLTCINCHAEIEESDSADERIMPGHDQCSACHPIFEPADACAKCHVDPNMPLGLPRKERHLKFSHKQHLSFETLELDCQHCHKGVAKVAFTGPDQFAHMSTCMECHDGALAPRECSVCHTQSIASLKPETHTFDFVVSHKHLARTSQDDCLSCHVEQYCQDCHDGGFGVPERNSVTDQYIPFEPEVAHTSKGQTIKRVHVLNYRFVHGIDAKSKLASCAGCHDTGTFCTDCHTEETSLDRLRPVWHGGSDWGAIAGAVGSGGGRHAEMARRDMELCVACHDEVTNDPVCMMCHIDRNPGLGNDPSTHGARFMHDSHGDWHQDEMSLCFDCHMNTRQAGIGFCGYCHGIGGEGDIDD
jgi:hypothetical protein